MKKLIAILMLCATTCFAWDTIYLDVPVGAKEADWRDALANLWHARTEQIIEFGRIDVETDLYVVEIDYLHKWIECLGQSIFYADSTGKQSVGALIIENHKINIQKLRMIEMLYNKYDIMLVVLKPKHNFATRPDKQFNNRSAEK